MTELANRSQVYSLHYVFLGHKQFSSEAYVLPDNADVILLDLKDFLIYQLQYPQSDPENRRGYARIRSLLTERHFAVTSYLDRFAVLQRTSLKTPPIELVTAAEPLHLSGQASSHGELSLLGWSTPSGILQTSSDYVNKRTYAYLPLSLTLKKNVAADNIRPVEFVFTRQGQVVYRQLLPLGGGILPSSDWPMGVPITSNYRLLIPHRLVGRSIDISARILDVAGNVVLNGLRSLSLQYTRYRQLGPTIDLGVFTP